MEAKKGTRKYQVNLKILQSRMERRTKEDEDQKEGDL